MKNFTLLMLMIGIFGIGLIMTGVILYRHFHMDMDQAYKRVSTGGKTVMTACGEIEYTEFGEGSPMLIVHGSGGGYDQGEYFARMIGGHHRWIAPSRFGFLGTPFPEGGNSELQAKAHACLLDSLGIEKVGVIGASLGGPSALLFTQQYPERTTSLVMISAASHPIPPRSAFQTAFFKLFLNDFVYWSMVHTNPGMLLDILGVPASFQKELSADEIAKAYAFLEDIMPMGARLQGQLHEGDMSQTDESLIQEIHTPSLVIHAADDTLVPFDHASLTAQSIADARLISLEKGGHLMLFFDVNRQALEQIQQFVDQHNP